MAAADERRVKRGEVTRPADWLSGIRIDSLKSIQKVFVASYKNLLEKVDTAAAQEGPEAEMRLTMKQRQMVAAVTDPALPL